MTHPTNLLPNQRASTTEAERSRRAQHLLALRADERAPAGHAEPIAVRLLGVEDRTDLDRLAELDSAWMRPGAQVLGAEIEGALVAAVSLDDGTVVANPFRPSVSAVELLRIRARQLGGAHPPRRRPGLFRRRGRSARASLAGSPPGAGGRLLQL